MVKIRKHRLDMVISGGQTGADQGALQGANKVLVETGGWAPKGYKTDTGPNPKLGSLYGLEETKSTGYPVRTKRNVRDSDGTLWIGEPTSPGGKLTLRTCTDLERPKKIIRFSRSDKALFRDRRDMAKEVAAWIRKNRIKVLNVAGNRESSNYGITQFTEDLIILTIRELRNPGVLDTPAYESPRERRRKSRLERKERKLKEKERRVKKRAKKRRKKRLHL